MCLQKNRMQLLLKPNLLKVYLKVKMLNICSMSVVLRFLCLSSNFVSMFDFNIYSFFFKIDPNISPNEAPESLDPYFDKASFSSLISISLIDKFNVRVF